MPLTPKYPPRHLSIRVPWHDAGWDGAVCQNPKQNGSCLKLPRIGESRDDDAEQAVAGKSLKVLNETEFPCCVGERGTFMADFEITRTVRHPYAKTSPETHGHFLETPFHQPAYSAPCVPFRWTRLDTAESLAAEHGLVVDPAWEPKLDFKSSWLQDIRYHQTLLGCFFGHIYPKESLCFFYAKDVPFAEDTAGRRILVGVGRVLRVGDELEYRYSQQNDALRSLVWERSVVHSIRPDFTDGFLLPYHAAIAYAAENPDFDPASILAYAPADRSAEFSYVSELVTHDGAIGALLACYASLTVAKAHLPGPWDQVLAWIDARLAELWTMRGPCPGLGAALTAFGVNLGTLAAREIAAKLKDNEDPWPLVDQVFQNPKAHLTAPVAASIGVSLQHVYKALPDERRALLHLLSRFELTPAQATLLYIEEERKKCVAVKDADILKNPYLIYELTRRQTDPVSVFTVDRGVFPPPVIAEKHPLPEPSALSGDGTDPRRVRAFVIERLERGAAGEGHTLLPRDQVVEDIRALTIQPPCPVNKDILGYAETTFGTEIGRAEMYDDSPAYQLVRLGEMGKVIRTQVTSRRSGKRHQIAEDWRTRLDAHLGGAVQPGDELEERARTEKAAALKELAESRFSVLLGSAGTGKTTLLSVLCGHPMIAAGEVLLLAPTGKARVRMEQASRHLKLKAFTIAQFLTRCDRFDPETQNYRLSTQAPTETAETVIVDEASMLTEEMLGALLQAVRNSARRLILVGDPKQLPPIGPGRPFVDIVSQVTPEGIEQAFPRVGNGFTELTIHRRQTGEGEERADLQLAQWFGGQAIEPGEDTVFHTVIKAGDNKHVRFLEWDTPAAFEAALWTVLAQELGLADPNDARGFDLSLGSTDGETYRYFNFGEAVQAVEAWQLLSPVRANGHGVVVLNRLIHKRFRANTIESARQRRNRKIPKPLGAEEIVYGDKVIVTSNHRRTAVWPKDNSSQYLANGEIGVAVGQFRKKTDAEPPKVLKVEFSSQPTPDSTASNPRYFQYSFFSNDFGEEGTPPLELAYALTVHRAQGSEFGLVILVLPNPCRLLSRELLYTALTRQRDRVVVLHQGSRADLKKYASVIYSDTARRLTNLFEKPRPVEVEGRFLEERLIHRTRTGVPVRSKSEVIVHDLLTDKGIEPLYEKPLTLGGVTRYPDFTIDDAASGKTYYWEHAGMMFDPAYRARWEAKKAWYRDHDILPHDEGGGPNGTLVVTYDTEEGGISSQEIDLLISELFGV
jgi:ATP-dependent exoDNAse (exonuclease V) alpha subunit